MFNLLTKNSNAISNVSADRLMILVKVRAIQNLRNKFFHFFSRSWIDHVDLPREKCPVNFQKTLAVVLHYKRCSCCIHM
jgi:hypothetical protein